MPQSPGTGASVPATAANPSGGVSEFFRYHGVWAPGVRLFRGIGFRAKALVISAGFALPLAVLSYSYYIDKAAAIEFSANERLGVQYLRAAMPVLSALQQQRLAAVQAAAGAAPGGAAEEAAAKLAKAMQGLAQAEAGPGAALGTAKAHADLQSRLKNLPSAAGADALQLLEAGNEAIAAAMTLITTATDNSNLTLDPDLDTYYLMDAATAALPGLTEALSRSQAMVTATAGKAELVPRLQRPLSDQVLIASLMEQRWATSVDKVMQLHPGVRSAFDVDAVQRKVAGFQQAAAGEGAAARVPAAAAESASGLAVVLDKTMDKLDQLIAARVARLEQARNITSLVLVLSLCAVVYLFLSFQKALDGGLREVAFHIEAMRDGDLTTHPRAWGADEAAALMNTLVDMQVALRRIVSKVRSASDNIVHASTEITNGSMDLSARTEQAASTLEQSASAMEQISATVKHTADAAVQASEIARQNSRAASRGGEVIGTMVTTMGGIQTASHRIGDIVGTIDAIAFQTNILALNAAVEAARAGDSGRGFAVVASEVRNLAMRSAAAAKEIKQLITSSVAQVATGTDVAREAGAAIAEIVEQASRVDQLMAAISTSSREQASGVQQTTKAVHDMDSATQQNAALVEQTAAAAASLQDQANSLAAEVAQFRLG